MEDAAWDEGLSSKVLRIEVPRRQLALTTPEGRKRFHTILTRDISFHRSICAPIPDGGAP